MKFNLWSLFSPRSAYEKMKEGLISEGYVPEIEGEGETIGKLAPGYVSVIYLDASKRQDKPPMQYTLDNILRDNPSRVLITDLGNGNITVLSRLHKNF